MNIKSLLLGSAAALVAVSAARAADAPVTMVEPEPVEYVRVCDVYGTGFFYIPGTETCLKIGGYVRMRINMGDKSFNQDDEDEDSNTGFFTRVRARLDFDAREETELGTLRGKVRVQATNTGNGSFTGDAGYGMDEAYIQLGGLTLGYLDSVWAGDDGGISDGLFADNDFSVGDFQQNRISYTAAFGGFSGTIGVEDDGTGDFVPDVLAKLAYKGGFGGAYIMGVFDEQQNTRQGDDGLGSLGAYDGVGNGDGIFGGTNGFGLPNAYAGFTSFNNLIVADDYDGGDSAFAVKGAIQLENIILADSLFKVEGHYAFDPTIYAVNSYLGDEYGIGANSPVDNIPAEWQVGVGYQQTFGKIFVAANGVYGELFDTNILYNVALDDDGNIDTFGLARNSDGGNFYGGSLNVGYQITSNFSALAEVSYREIDLKGGLNDYDQTGGLIEFKRTF